MIDWTLVALSTAGGFIGSAVAIIASELTRIRRVLEDINRKLKP